MFEIHTDDGVDIVLAAHPSLPAALAGTKQIAAECRRQLAANGEGHTTFMLHLAIRDGTTGQDVAWAVVGA